MSADMSARSVSRTLTGGDRVRALQRVLYRCAKQEQDRRFHALFDHVARSDVMLRAWREVRANRGAPGVDGVSIEQVERSRGSETCRSSEVAELSDGAVKNSARTGTILLDDRRASVR